MPSTWKSVAITSCGPIGRDFGAWSDHMVGLIGNDAAYRNCCEPFLKAAAESAKEADLLHSYRLSLANLILNFKPLVSPSTFLLDVKGQAAKPDTPAPASKNSFHDLYVNRSSQ